MLRSIGKTCFAFAYTWTDAHRVFRRDHENMMPFIVCYHRVVEDFERSRANTIPSMLISKRMLERQLDWLAKRFAIMSLDEIGAHLETGRTFHRRAAAVTFDDGYSDVYRHAYPLLRRKGIPAGLFIVTDMVETGRPQVFDRLYLLLQLLRKRGIPLGATVARALQSKDTNRIELSRMLPLHDEPFSLMTLLLNSLPQQRVETVIAALQNHVPIYDDSLDEMTPLTWDMVETMHRGGMTIGSHTKTHLLLTAETTSVARTELAESKQQLESRLNGPVRHFAYPDGRFNSSVVQAVEASGYSFAYGICQSRDSDRPLLTIPRKVLWERSCVNALGRFSPAVMNCQTLGAFELSGRCAHDHVTVREEVMHGTNC